MKHSLLHSLAAAFPQGVLCKSEKSLRRRFEEKLATKSFKDRRNKNSGRPGQKLCVDCRALMLGGTVELDGDYSQAWRRLHLSGQLCEECGRKWKYDVRTNKSYVPRSVMRDIVSDVAAALPHRRGPKHVRLQSPYVKRNWGDTAPGDYGVCDDATPDHAIYGRVELPLSYDFDHAGRPFIGRLEALFQVDERSEYPMAHLLILGDPGTLENPSQTKASYTMVHQRLLLLRAHDSLGLPYKGWKLENGPWRNRLMDGENVEKWTTLSFARFQNGIADVTGRRIIRMTSGNPRSKIIERVFGALWSRMKCQPGYLGNNERLDRRELVQDLIARVKKGKEHPGNELLSAQQFRQLLDDELMAFADEPQNGERLPGVSPKEAFLHGIGRCPGHLDRPLEQLGPDARWLLATHEREVTVGPKGIVFDIGKCKYVYWGNELTPYQHRKVLARFNLEEPELLSVTPPDGARFILKERTIDANDASKEELAATSRDRASWVRHGKIIFDNLQHPFRSTIVDDNRIPEEVRDYGKEHNAEVEKFRAEKRAAGKAKKAAKAAGIDTTFATRHPDRVQGFFEMKKRAEQLRAKKRTELAEVGEGTQE